MDLNSKIFIFCLNCNFFKCHDFTFFVNNVYHMQSASAISNFHGTDEKARDSECSRQQKKKSEILVFHIFKNGVKLVLYLVL